MSQSTHLQQRYGRSQHPRWIWLAIAAVGIAIGVAFAAWVGFQDRPITARVWAYDVTSDNQVTITLDVVRPEPLAVTCTVYAQADDHSVVGEKTIELAPSTRKEQRFEVDVQTERRAVTGVLRTCVERD